MTQADLDRYDAACHAMQSGVATEMSMNLPSAAVSPKHLRVGINIRAVDHAAMVSLLLTKGIITLDEYHAALANQAEAEKKQYEADLSRAIGRPVTLG